MALQVISEPTTFTGGLSANNFPISVGGGVTTSSTAPSSPSAGSLWFNTENGNLYIYYNDGDSQQWVAADNSGGGGKVAQVVVASTNVPVTTTAIIATDDTIPQNTEGAEFMTISITPTNSNSTLIIEFFSWGSASNIAAVTLSLFEDSNVNAFYAVAAGVSSGNACSPFYIRTTLPAISMSSRTYKLRFGPSYGVTATMLRTNANASFYGSTDSATFTITEILP
jgi:hypothetical protein